MYCCPLADPESDPSAGYTINEIPEEEEADGEDDKSKLSDLEKFKVVDTPRYVMDLPQLNPNPETVDIARTVCKSFMVRAAASHGSSSSPFRCMSSMSFSVCQKMFVVSLIFYLFAFNVV